MKKPIALLVTLLALSACGDMPREQARSSEAPTVEVTPSEEPSQTADNDRASDLVCSTSNDKLQVLSLDSDSSLVPVTSDKMTPGCVKQWADLQAQGYTEASLKKYKLLCDRGDRANGPTVVEVPLFYAVVMPEAYDEDVEHCG